MRLSSCIYLQLRRTGGVRAVGVGVQDWVYSHQVCRPAYTLRSSMTAPCLRTPSSTTDTFSLDSRGRMKHWSSKSNWLPDLDSLHLLAGLGRSPGEENSNPLQYSCLENSMDGGTWQATVWGRKEDTTEWISFCLHLWSRVKSRIPVGWGPAGPHLHPCCPGTQTSHLTNATETGSAALRELSILFSCSDK